MRRSALFIALWAAAGIVQAEPWTYRGTLTDGGQPAQGPHTFRLTLLDERGAKALTGPVTLVDVPVTDGRFQAEVDFGIDLQQAPAMKLLTEVRGDDKKFVALGAPTRFDPKAAMSGMCWDTEGNFDIVDGTNFVGTTNNVALDFRVFNQRQLRIESGLPDRVSPNIIGGSPYNYATFGVRGATIAGGGVMTGTGSGLDPDFTNEAPNRVTDAYGTIGGGFDNVAGDGTGSAIDRPFAVVGGGQGNVAQNSHAVVGGGYTNKASGFYSTVAGGHNNIAAGIAAGVPGGGANCAGANYSWAGGYRAKVRAGAGTGGCPGIVEHPSSSSGDSGTFVWADSGTDADFVSSSPNQFLVRATAGFGLNAPPPDINIEATLSSNGGTPNFAELWLRQSVSGAGFVFSAEGLSTATRSSLSIDNYNGSERIRRALFNNDGSLILYSDMSTTVMGRTGVQLATGSGSWSTLSDRSLKTAIAAIDPLQVLQGVLDLPLSTWSYIAQGGAIRHMGPMAQDFAAAFGLGESDTHISTVDADGVALAAIQGLNAKLERENAELKTAQSQLSAQLERLRQRLEALESKP